VLVRDAGPDDVPWIRALLDERWDGQEQVADVESYRPAELPGFIAAIGDERVGYERSLSRGPLTPHERSR
jgi:hypothetical protein